MDAIQNMSRRNFVKVVGLASGGLIIGCQFTSCNTEIVRIDDGTTFTPNLFVQLKKDGTLILLASRSEMGQGIRTSLTSVIADEMDADWNFVTVVQATGDSKFGNQNTDGSRSIRTIFEPMLKIGATSIAFLIPSSLKLWNISISSFKTQYHYVINTITNAHFFSAYLLDASMHIPVPTTFTFLDQKAFNYI